VRKEKSDREPTARLPDTDRSTKLPPRLRDGNLEIFGHLFLGDGWKVEFGEIHACTTTTAASGTNIKKRSVGTKLIPVFTVNHNTHQQIRCKKIQTFERTK
jgi:hypothetical protein